MERKALIATFLGGLAAISLGVWLEFGGQPPADDQRHAGGLFPWQVETTPAGGSRVFGLELSRSSLRQAEERFRTEAEIILFATDDGQYAAEAYFDRIDTGGLAAKLVVAADIPRPELEEMFKRGLRISSSGPGRRKVTLHPDDVARVRQAPIATLTYLPSTRIDDKVVKGRFGDPARRIRERNTEVVHWLYPRIGLDIALSPKEKPVLQYVAPAQFDRLMAPLVEKGEPEP